MNKILLIFILVIIVQKSNGQLNEHFNDIKATFKPNKQKELTTIEKKLNDAEIKFADAQQIFSSGEISKGLNMSKKVANIFDKYYRDLFFIYEEGLDSLSKSLSKNKADYVTYLLNKAKNSLRISISDRLEAKYEDDKKIAFGLLDSAHKNEIDAINYQSKAFGVINGWEDNNLQIKKESYSYEDAYKNTNTENFHVKDFTVNDFSAPENYTFNKNAVIEEGYNTSVEEAENSTTSQLKNPSVDVATNNSQNENLSYNSTNGASSDNSETEFRIQIGTSILPASKSQIKRLNPTDLDVKTYKSKIYYKYTIGQFPSYQEAKHFKNAYGLKKTYIAEYKNGKEVKFYYKDM